MTSYKYKAFISYKHGLDTDKAKALALGIQRYAKPLTAFSEKVFRDEKNLASGDNLGKEILKALEESEYLVYIASPEAANSKYVQSELDYWVNTLKRKDNLIIVLSRGNFETLDN